MEFHRSFFLLVVSLVLPVLLTNCTTTGKGPVMVELKTAPTWNLHGKYANSCGHLIVATTKTTVGGLSGTQLQTASGHFFFVDKSRRFFDTLNYMAAFAHQNGVPICLRIREGQDNRVVAISFESLQTFEENASVALDDESRSRMIQAMEFSSDGRLLLHTYANEVGELLATDESTVLDTIRVASTSYLRFGQIRTQVKPNTLIIEGFRLLKPAIGPLPLESVSNDSINKVQATYDLYRQLRRERQKAFERAIDQQEEVRGAATKAIARRWQARETDPVSFYEELAAQEKYKKALESMPKPKVLNLPSL